MGKLFHLILVQPILNLLILIYNILPWPDIGLATIILTVIIRLILAPLFNKSTKQQIMMNRLQPLIQKIQKQYKDDKEKLAKAQLELYRKYKVSPFGNLAITLIQLPIMLAVYRVFLLGFGPDIIQNNLYSFISQPQTINTLFLGFINLNKANVFMALLAAAVQYLSTKLSMSSLRQSQQQKNNQNPSQKMANALQKQMVFLGPIMTFVILVGLPSILGLYWVTTTLFSVAQQWYILKNFQFEEVELE
ncbi:MAG TPA: YidC/Oxa1 family membrane protein insertase [Candidatus Paceibacterota bacterium]|nr:YidC/Oxa1 family membrane protein insertase [Candidatus Paceibacterota bacterium]HOL53900.1 YidC/Oxa1 family membrane protein insertase [Candidatus Paceibacterota bacterium]HON21682.1 YidC/Oxa1 family membrane protein insertase [Candidatus Paceibacterota bacterium]HOV88804.1 YidC/Oxa1 family membrane protein insertase [Candidatus Paceibacterota bacterium]HPP17189.1 YidC/Oxa1 family membrane protein insertase [Candidatus Paceibacterota bacterium]